MKSNQELSVEPSQRFECPAFILVWKVLELLVRAVNENMLDAQQKPARDLRPQVLELFGRLTSKVDPSPRRTAFDAHFDGSQGACPAVSQ